MALAACPREPLLATNAPTSAAEPDTPGAVWQRAAGLVGSIALSCVAVLAVAWTASFEYPTLFSHSLVAFGLGLRHAVDCDHLAAIDNVTRQLMNQGQRPISVGFWFAWGHSTIVLLLTAVLAGGYSWAWHEFGEGSSLTETITLVAAIMSIAILLVIGLMNAHIAVGLLREWVGLQSLSTDAQEKQLERVAADSLKTALQSIPGVRRIFERVSKPSNMYAVGFLFGLSFDSATQVGLIGLAAMTGTAGRIPPAVVMLFPLAFSCGMCLIDTSNGLLMLATYSWTKLRPVQKLLYNFVVTAISAGIALIICTLEVLQIVGAQFHLTGPVWDFIENVDMATIGYTIILSFLLIFLGAVLYSKGCCADCCRCEGESAEDGMRAPVV